MQESYTRALEDSNIVLQEIRPAFENQRAIIKLQNERYLAARIEWDYKEKLHNLQVDGLREQVKTEVQQNRKSFWKGFKTGSLVPIVVTGTLLFVRTITH